MGGTTSKTVGSSMAQLLTAAAQGNEDYVGIAARDTANAMKVGQGRGGCVGVGGEGMRLKSRF